MVNTHMSDEERARCLQRLAEDIQLQGLSKSSVTQYTHAASHFLDFCKDKSVDDLNEEDLRQYLLYLTNAGYAPSTRRSVRAELLYFFHVTLGRDISKWRIPAIKVGHHLPVIVSSTDMACILNCTDSIMYRAIFSLAYGSGLRISEIRNLTVDDIDRKNHRVFVRGKGDKERYTVLSNLSLKLMGEYWRSCRSNDDGCRLMFSCHPVGKQVSTKSINKELKLACQKAGIRNADRITMHCLRHSFATDLVDHHTELTVVRDFMGHSSLSTTSVYLHTSTCNTSRVVSPADRL